MSLSKKSIQKHPFTKLSLAGIGLCALCCVLPVIAPAFGIGSLSVLAFYLEKAGIGPIILGVLLFFLSTSETVKTWLNVEPHVTVNPQHLNI